VYTQLRPFEVKTDIACAALSARLLGSCVSALEVQARRSLTEGSANQSDEGDPVRESSASPSSK